MPLDATQLEKRYREGFQSGAPRWTEGVRNTDKDWASRTSAAKSRAVTGYQRAMSDGTFERGIQRRGTGGWRQRSIDKQANYAAASERATAGFVARIADMIAVDNQVRNQINSMPRNTFEDRIAVMVANARLRSDAWRQRNGG